MSPNGLNKKAEIKQNDLIIGDKAKTKLNPGDETVQWDMYGNLTLKYYNFLKKLGVCYFL